MLKDLAKKLLDKLNPGREPLRYLATALVAGYVAYQILAEGRAPAEVLAEDSPVIAVVALVEELARMKVFSPKSVEDREKADADKYEEVSANPDNDDEDV